MAEARQDREQKTPSSSEAFGKRSEQNRQAPSTARSSSVLSKRNDYPLALSPFDLFRRASREMERSFYGGLMPSWGLSGLLAPELSESLWTPEVDMFERNGKLIVRADLPGLNKDDVKVELRDDVLTIEGERSEEHEETTASFFRSERSYGAFHRAIPLPEGTGENCKASFTNGVLEITMDAPKQKQRIGRRIEISEGNG